MAKISFVLPCEPFWHKGIYQLEVSDFATGYDPVLATDGPANRQWRELGDRSLYLRRLLELEHGDGRHRIRAGNLRPDTMIPERTLRLDCPTAGLAKDIADLKTGTDRAFALLNQRNEQDLSAAGILGRVLPWVNEYFDSGASFDLPGEISSLRGFTASEITRAIAGDDSLDVVSTEGIVVGNTYFLMDRDGGNLESATALAVLTENRVRFAAALSRTRSDGFLSSASIPPARDGALVKGALIYYSDWADTLVNAKSGKLYVHRDSASVCGSALWQEEPDGPWQEAALIGCESFYDGTVDDVFSLPGKRLRLVLKYPETAGAWRLYWLALAQDAEFVLPETVRRPKIASASIAGGQLTVATSPYASLWGLAQGGFELRLGRPDFYGETPLYFSVAGESRGMSVTLPETVLNHASRAVAARHWDIEGTRSRWSKNVILE